MSEFTAREPCEMEKNEKIVRLEKIVFLYEKKMYIKALNIIGDEHLAEDIVQESFSKIMHCMDKIDDVDSAVTKALILTIVRNTSIDYYRREKRLRAAVEQMSQMPHSLYDEFPEAEILSQTVIGGEIEELILKLSEKDQAVLFLKYGADFSNEKIAVLLGIEETAVRKRLSRARIRLAAMLREESEGGR